MNERHVTDLETKLRAIHLEMDISNVFSPEFREYTKRVYVCRMAQNLSKCVGGGQASLDDVAHKVSKSTAEEVTKDSLKNVLKALPRLLTEIEREVLDDPTTVEKLWSLLTVNKS